MFLGEVTISEKAVKEIQLKTIYKELQEYKENIIHFIEQQLDGLEQDTMLESNLLFKKEIFIGDKLALYIETYKNNGGTRVFEGMEYLEREIGNFTFNIRENNFLKTILEEYREEGTPFEKKTAERILRKLITLEMYKKDYKEKLEE